MVDSMSSTLNQHQNEQQNLYTLKFEPKNLEYKDQLVIETKFLD